MKEDLFKIRIGFLKDKPNFIFGKMTLDQKLGQSITK